MKTLSLAVAALSLTLIPGAHAAAVEMVENKAALQLLIAQAPLLKEKAPITNPGSILEKLTNTLISQFSPSGDPVFELKQITSECEKSNSAIKVCEVAVNSGTYRWDPETRTTTSVDDSTASTIIFRFQMETKNSKSSVVGNAVRVNYRD